MSVLVPFKAYRPNNSDVKDISCRPYDVLNTKEARESCINNPNSFYHIIKPEIDFSDDADCYSSKVYKKGKENFDKW